MTSQWALDSAELRHYLTGLGGPILLTQCKLLFLKSEDH